MHKWGKIYVKGCDDLKKITDEILMPEIARLAGAKTYGN